MQTTLEEFLIEYQYTPSSDAEERLVQAWDIILALILENYENEQKSTSESDQC